MQRRRNITQIYQKNLCQSTREKYVAIHTKTMDMVIFHEWPKAKGVHCLSSRGWKHPNWKENWPKVIPGKVEHHLGNPMEIHYELGHFGCFEHHRPVTGDFAAPSLILRNAIESLHGKVNPELWKPPGRLISIPQRLLSIALRLGISKNPPITSNNHN